jgi:hypothetical protein
MEQQKVDRRQAKEIKSADIRKAEETKKSLRAVKRHSEKNSSMLSETGQDGMWPTAKRVCRATASQVWQGFQGMMQGLHGIKRRARQGEVHFADIPDTRVASAIRSGAYRFFCKDDDFSFLVDMAEQLPVDQRQAFIEDVLTRFRHEGSAVLKRADIRQVGSARTHQFFYCLSVLLYNTMALALHTCHPGPVITRVPSHVAISCVMQNLGLCTMDRKMPIADAVILCTTGHYTERGWNAMAASVNNAINPTHKKKAAGFVPGFRAIQSELKRMGAQMDMEDIKVVLMRVLEDGVIDLTEDDSVHADVDVLGATGTSEQPAADMRGVYVKDVMRQVARELVKIREEMPRVYEHMRKNGVHIVLAVDNTSRQVFSGCTLKLEQGCVKIVLPLVKSAQQSPSMAIPIFFFEGMLHRSQLVMCCGSPLLQRREG